MRSAWITNPRWVLGRALHDGLMLRWHGVPAYRKVAWPLESWAARKKLVALFSLVGYGTIELFCVAPSLMTGVFLYDNAAEGLQQP
jgi:hypothetical protein